MFFRRIRRFGTGVGEACVNLKRNCAATAPRVYEMESASNEGVGHAPSDQAGVVRSLQGLKACAGVCHRPHVTTCDRVAPSSPEDSPRLCRAEWMFGVVPFCIIISALYDRGLISVQNGSLRKLGQ
jgi:hypothetical protein